MKTWLGDEHPDPDMKPWYWLNTDKAQTHHFVSFLNEVYPLKTEIAHKIEAKPGYVTMLPHRYFRVWTRDLTPAKGKILIADAAEEYSPKSFRFGGVFGVERAG